MACSTNDYSGLDTGFQERRCGLAFRPLMAFLSVGGSDGEGDLAMVSISAELLGCRFRGRFFAGLVAASVAAICTAGGPRVAELQLVAMDGPIDETNLV